MQLIGLGWRHLNRFTDPTEPKPWNVAGHLAGQPLDAMREKAHDDPMRTALLAFLSVSALSYAQSVISAHSGVVQYVEGDVMIDNQSIQPKFAEFPDVKPNQVLATEEGRVELLLTPGVFLRLSENSSVRMISNSLSDTRLAMVAGSALIEVAELLPNNSITFEASGTSIVLPRKGLYRIDADPARLRVYDGQATVAGTSVRKGREVALGASAALATTFDVKDTDSFYRWSSRRAEYVAEANVESARVASNPMSSGYTEGVSSPNGRWSWNPGFGMFTYLPGSGMYNSPFGSTYYSTMMAPAYVAITAPSLGRTTSATPIMSLPMSLPTSLPAGRGMGMGASAPMGGSTGVSGGASSRPR